MSETIKLVVLNELKPVAQFNCAGPNPQYCPIPEDQQPQVLVYEQNGVRLLSCQYAEQSGPGVNCTFFKPGTEAEMAALRSTSTQLEGEYQSTWSIRMGEMTRNPGNFSVHQRQRDNGIKIFQRSTHPCRPAYATRLSTLATQNH